MFGPPLAKFKIKKFEKEIEPQETLLDSLAQKKEKEVGLSEKRLERPLSQKILRLFWFSTLILIVLLFAKTFQLQVFEGKAYLQLSEENQFAVRFIQAQRGVIYDKNLNQLVFNKPSFDLICQTADLPQTEAARDKIFKEISEIINKDLNDLEREITESGKNELLIAENLDRQTLILLEARGFEFPGFEIKNNTVREYYLGSVFSHLIGYQRKTGEKMGLEGYYDETLKANPGELQVKRDVYGNPIAKEIIALPESGESLVLYLDSLLQEKAVDTLSKVIRNIGSKAGAVVALDPRTGGVLALASLPNFDNNLFSQEMSQTDWDSLFNNPQKPLFNRAIAGEYPTGSTIKPLIAAAALEEEIIGADESINCLGKIIIPNPWVANASSTKQDWTVHGWTDMRKAIAESCNVYFYTVGGGYQERDGLGPSLIKEYLELFGWGSTSHIDLAGEREGLIPGPSWKKQIKGEGWWDGDTYNLAIGQGDILVTPLQVASSFVVLANQGTLYQPQIVKAILDSEKNIIRETEPIIARDKFIAQDHLQVVREGMREAVIYGSSVLLSSLPIKAAAKTGTAQTWQEDVYHNWVTVFAPYDDPEIVLTVMIENVPGMQVASLSVAKEVLEWYFSQ